MKKKYLVLICVIIFIDQISLFKNIFDTIFRPYHWRLVREYGICDKMGYGFAKNVNQMNYFKENIRILNFANYPSIDSLFYENNRITSEKYFILVNFDQENEKHINKLKKFPYSIRKSIEIQPSFKILKKELSCYLISKK